MFSLSGATARSLGIPAHNACIRGSLSSFQGVRLRGWRVSWLSEILLSNDNIQKPPPHRTDSPAEENSDKMSRSPPSCVWFIWPRPQATREWIEGAYIHEQILCITIRVCIPEAPRSHSGGMHKKVVQGQIYNTSTFQQKKDDRLFEHGCMFE